MILPSSRDEQDIVLSSKQFKTSKFTIAASAKAFKILSNSLYTNKIRAVVRELGCNAYDSHVANGNPDTPFLVIAPTTIAPEFAIRDYGTGMDADTVTNLYSTYFGSSKTESNDFVGALGLGSKTPFSYTDSFVVTSWINNPNGEGTIEYKFNAYISDIGEPSIAKMSTRESTEPTGVMIQVGVNPADIRDWEREIDYVYATFKIPPIVNGYSVNYAVPESVYNIDLNGLDTTIYSLGGSSVDSGIYILMGNIPYPIPSVVCNKAPTSNITNIIGRYSRRAIMIEVPIGTVEMTPSRESLSIEGDTETTLVNILTTLNSVIVEKTLENLKNEYLAGKSPSHIIKKLNAHSMDSLTSYSKIGISDYVGLFNRVYNDICNSVDMVRYGKIVPAERHMTRQINIGRYNIQPVRIYIQDVDRLMYKSELISNIKSGSYVIRGMNKTTKRLIKGIKTVFGLVSVTYMSDMINEIRTNRAEKRRAKLVTDGSSTGKKPTKTYQVYVSGSDDRTEMSWADIKQYANTHKVYITGSQYDSFDRKFTETDFQYRYVNSSRYHRSRSISNAQIAELLKDVPNYIYVPAVPSSQFIKAKIDALYIWCPLADRVQNVAMVGTIRLRQSKWALIKAVRNRFNSGLARLIENLENHGVDIVSILGSPSTDLSCTFAKVDSGKKWRSEDEQINQFVNDSSLLSEYSDALRRIGDELKFNFTRRFPFLVDLESKTYMASERTYIDVYSSYIKSVVELESKRVIPSYYVPVIPKAPMVYSHYNPVIKRKKKTK